ncbi:SDR family oxidoreductase [Streptomyces minutiscleroticus]|uniref:Short-chain dehydrogenase/reductase n=1 Tax=Streptomyces minutiscleroticus TaxID=68238 RepID=A0A918KEB1_9ACTN|nr:SDR family oxidoreductase [Streptomyces minutiscleroticus]GGX59553.1 short-chain dehydrogenase/reductase [Streptomyces minutiscleroticus]
MTARTWLITGVSSGLGRRMTERLLADGDRVAGTVRDPDAVADLKSAYGDQLWPAELDVTDLPGVRRVVDEAFEELGRIDVVVNNAGYGLFGAAEELSDEQVRHEIDTNMTGSVQVARAALPHLREQGGGRIIQISTYGGQATHPGATLYHASKWGIEGFMESLAKEVAAFGIEVTIVEPGGARTGFRSGGARLAEPLAAYDGTPAAVVRGIRNAPPSPGDPAKMAAAIIESAGRTPAPRRLVLGSDSYRFMHDALTERLAELEAQKESAATTDSPAA